MLVRYFMSTDVITLSSEAKCIEVLKKFKDNNIRRAPVMDKERLVGIVSTQDLYRVLAQASGKDIETDKDKKACHIMTREVHVLNPNDHVEKAAQLMLRHKIGGIPVMKGRDLEGIITESDIFKSMWDILSHPDSFRILFFEKEEAPEKEPNDYIKLCLKHNCIVNTFITYPKPDGGNMHYLCIKGSGADKLINDLWACSCDIIFTEKNK